MNIKCSEFLRKYEKPSAILFNEHEKDIIIEIRWVSFVKFKIVKVERFLHYDSNNRTQ